MPEEVMETFTIKGHVNLDKEALGVNITKVITAESGEEVETILPIHDLTFEQIFKPFDKQRVRITIEQIERGK